MLRSEMNAVLRRINNIQIEIDRCEKISDKAFVAGDKQKADKREQMAYEKALYRNGMIDAMAALGFRIEHGIIKDRKPNDPSIIWVVNEIDELKLR